MQKMRGGSAWSHITGSMMLRWREPSPRLARSSIKLIVLILAEAVSSDFHRVQSDSCPVLSRRISGGLQYRSTERFHLLHRGRQRCPGLLWELEPFFGRDLQPLII